MQNPMESCQGPSGFIFILSFVLLMYIMFNKSGDSISDISGIVLNPLIGFSGKFPLLTMLCGGIITISVSSTVRHFMADWVDTAKKQKVMNEYNKVVREATKSGNQSLQERLNTQQQEIMGMQSSMMMTQMKSSIMTMVIAILIFRWIYSFIWSVPQPTITLPWDTTWALTDMAFEQLCGSMCILGGSGGAGGGMPYWIFVYIIVTIPIGQALMRGLKYFEFSRKLKAQDESVFGEMIHFVEETVEEGVKGDHTDDEKPKKRRKKGGGGGKKGGKGKDSDGGKKPRKAPKLRNK